MTAPLRVREAGADELAGWDSLARRFPGHRIGHTRAWIDSLEASGCGTPLFLVFEQEHEVVGCLPGLLATAGPWRLFGSPRVGWQTVSMGPVFDPARTTTEAIMAPLVPFLEQQYGVAHIEMMHTALDADAMRTAGFAGQPVFTYRVPLFPGDEPQALRLFKDSARRNVRRAERLGLEVRFEEQEAFVDEHYEQLREVYARNGTTIPFPKRRILECFRHLQGSGNLIAVSVWLPGSKVNIATGMFLVENRELSLWMWAHRSRYRWYRPTELMTWSVMRRAMALGCDRFDLMGGGIFKTRFGAEPDRAKMRWLRSRPRWLAAARTALGTGFRLQQTVRGAARQVTRRAATALLPQRARHTAAACVLGDIDLVRALALGGIRSDVVAPPGDPARFSRFTRSSLDWHDPGTRSEALVDALVAHGQAQPEPPPLFYDTDGALLFLSRHRERLGQSFRFVLPEARLVEDLVDKGRFQALAQRLQLPVPPARVIQPERGLDLDTLGLEFPVVVKPLTRRAATWRPVAGEHKAMLYNTPWALEEAWPRLTGTGLPLLIQSFIPGPETAIESYHAYVDGRGDTVAEFTGRKLRTWPLTCGDSTALVISDAPDVVAIGRGVLHRLKLRGVAKLDFKRAPDGRLHLLEINPRFTLWHHPAAHAGLNVPAIVFADLMGLPRPAAGQARAGVAWCRPWADYRAVRATNWPLHAWLRWVASCEAVRAVALDDPLPLIGAAAWRWRHQRAPGGGASATVSHHLHATGKASS